MTLAPCPQCGTRTTPGFICAQCGTPTPAPLPDATVALEAGQWQSILQRLQQLAAPKYQVIKVLGYGGMAGVYLAEEPRLGRKVAIKVMAPALMMDPRLVDRFVQEARTIAQLNHPNIVTIYEVDEREDLHWFAMSFVGGRSLANVLADNTSPLPIDVVRALLYQIGDALSFAHQRGIVHRDIKPGNVLLDTRGNALVSDFGIAKVADAEAGLTRTGVLVGTPAYMSPEQCSSGVVTGASDQYALGAVVYHMLTGQPPFTGPTLSVLQAHVAQEPVPITRLRKDCPENLAAAVERMLRKRPEERWPSISAAISAAGALPPGLDGPTRDQLELLAAAAAGISVSPWAETLAEGTRQRLQVLVIDENGRVLPGRRVDWNVSNPHAAAVTMDNRLDAFSPGLTQIRARSGNAFTTLTVTVRPDLVRRVELEPARVALRPGQTTQLSAIVFDLDGSRLEDRAVLWSSTEPSVATVSNTGLVDAVAPGHAVITAHSGGQSATTSVTVAVSQPTLPEPRDPAPAPPPVPARAHPQTPAPATTGRKRWVVAGGIVLVALTGVGLIITRPWQNDALPPVLAPETEPEPIILQPTVVEDPNPVAALPPDSLVRTPEPEPPPATGRATASPQRPVQTATPPTPNVTTTPAPTDGLVQIQGDLPEGATITVTDAFGRARAIAGRSVRLDPGSYSLELRAPGHEPDRRTLTIQAGATETWTPIVRPSAPPAQVTPPQPQPQPATPVRDARADQAAIETEIRGFVAALDRREQNTVLPLLTQESRAGWQHLLTHRDVRDFRARLNSVNSARVDGAAATVQFSLGISYRNLGENINQSLNWSANLIRTTVGWRISQVQPRGN